MTELKPCPFCGGTPNLITDRAYHAIGVFCSLCSGRVETIGYPEERDSEDLAEQCIVNAWNRRVGDGT